MMDESLLPKKWRIQNEYCTFTRTSYWTKENGKAKMNWRHERSGYKNQAKFKESLRLVYFGRCKADIGMDLPHVYKVYEVEPSNEMSLGLEKGYRYSELLNCPSLIPDANIPMDRKNVPKLDRLCELIENDFSDSSVMVYCFHLAAQDKIKEELEKIEFNEPKIKVITNVTAEFIKSRDEIKGLLERQIKSSVRWNETIEKMLDMGVDTFVEFGPGRVLSSFVKEISREKKLKVNIFNVEDMKSLNKVLDEVKK